ncbi:hypothetical protein OH491_20940 [Termitidicoccus mucosus]|uniref:hypothetical protein n=1 Tax=Termitidicoccus mucosus TaxID=1184151 RepID=UPI002FEE3DF5
MLDASADAQPAGADKTLPLTTRCPGPYPPTTAVAEREALAADSPALRNSEPVLLWDWINHLLTALGEKPVARRIPLRAATAIGACCEAAWRVLPLRGEPPMTRFIAAELAKDHWFDLSAARRDLGYESRISMAEGAAALIAHLKNQG